MSETVKRNKLILIKSNSMSDQNIIEHEPKVFNFRRHWAKKCKPHLFKAIVVSALDFGMHDIQYNRIMRCKKRGLSTDNMLGWDDVKEPWKMSGFELRRPKPHSVNWYRPFGYCWGIAPFCMELGRCIYPELEWRIITGYKHTVAVGFKDKKPYVVFDILNFDTMSAREILNFAGYKGPRTKKRVSDAGGQSEYQMAEAA